MRGWNNRGGWKCPKNPINEGAGMNGMDGKFADYNSYEWDSQVVSTVSKGKNAILSRFYSIVLHAQKFSVGFWNTVWLPWVDFVNNK